jgi:hypothetical protein
VAPKPLKDNLRKRSAADLRDERDRLGGWVRQPEVRWLDPGILARAGVEVAVSSTFGRFADKREIQTQGQPAFDYSTEKELWIDYLSDTGDGWASTQTMAWLLAQPSLPFDETQLPRGKVLLLGGDQVYPTATPDAYEDRFKGPFAAALPQSDPGQEPDMFATPGNHDWYDGLVSFLRLFCTSAWIGGWRTRQCRSYFALKLPNRWWIWAIDIQLDTYIDDVQLKHFSDLPIGPGDKVILLTAKPSWVSSVEGRVEPPSWRFLSFFEERMVRDTGARLVLTITGDRHHYARYEPDGEGADEAPTRITAGGGGAYLSPTHTLPPEIKLKPLPRHAGGEATKERPTVVNRREEIYPLAVDSRRLSNGILKLAALNPAFGRLFGAIYVLLAIALLGALNTGEGSLVANATGDGFLGFLASSAGGMSLVLAVALFGWCYGATDVRPGALQHEGSSRLKTGAARVGLALAQTVVHLLAASLVIWVAIDVAPRILDAAIAVWVLGLLAAFLVGRMFGTTVFAFFLWLVHKVRGSKSQANANLVFTGQSIIDYKNLLRMCLGRDGGLTIYPLGVDEACRSWDLVDEQPAPRFEPRTHAPQVHPIDRALRFDPSGDRIA